MPDQIYSVKWNDVSKKNYTYDGLGRVTSQTVYPSVGVSLDNTYAYKDVGENNTSTQVSRVTNALGTYDYEYDANGNITKITFTAPSGSSGSYVREYQYDHLNRITSTYDSKYGYRHEYEYDTNSNIISRNRYSDYYNNGTEPDRIYTYDYDNTVWTDLLTAFCGDEITYDEIGNPLDYYNNTVFTWQNGRQLASITKGGKTTTYTYNADGQRISKTVDGVTTEFIYAGDILAGQKTGDNILMWIYDNNGSYIGFTYNGVEYYYVYNLQGDVEAITDFTGTIVARYEYDTWGEVEYELNYNGSVNIAEINPIRYRGYYYDSERGFYYLNSRYYDPGICRFINADGYVSTGQGLTSFNMFAYCGNNPVNRADPTGNRFCAAGSVEKESAYDRFISCDWQKQLYLEKFNTAPIGRTEQGNVYLVKNKSEVLTSFPGDIVIIDNRHLPGKYSSVQIVNSAIVTDQRIQRQVLVLLTEYESAHPSGWNREVDEMMVEWEAHNDVYWVWANKRCLHVDLDNGDKNLSYLDFWWRAISETLN